MSHPLLELQAADTMADQLRHRREHMAEREQVQAAKNALVRWNEARTMVRKRIEELGSLIEQSEAKSAGLDKHKARLASQLKTVIAPREAEALQHEMATIDQQRSALDDAELEMLEEQARLDDELTTLLDQESALRDTYLGADATMTAALTDIDRELTRIAGRLDGLRSHVDAATLQRYDRLRKNVVVAASPLIGSRCEGCHLDLSAAEVDIVRADAAAAGSIADCPQCGRLLIV